MLGRFAPGMDRATGSRESPWTFGNKIMKIHCQITPEDYVRAQFLHMRPRPLLKWFGLLVALVIVIVNVLNIGVSSDDHSTWRGFLLLGAIAYLVLLFGVLIPRRAKRIYRQQKTLQVPYESELTDDAYEAEAAYGKSKVSWRDFHKYKLGPFVNLGGFSCEV